MLKTQALLKEKEQCLLVFFFCVDFLFFKSKTPAHEIDFL